MSAIDRLNWLVSSESYIKDGEAIFLHWEDKREYVWSVFVRQGDQAILVRDGMEHKEGVIELLAWVRSQKIPINPITQEWVDWLEGKTFKEISLATNQSHKYVFCN